MSASDFWHNKERAKKISREFSDIKEELEIWDNFLDEINDLIVILENSPEDKSIAREAKGKLKELEDQFQKLEFELFFGGRYDKNNAIISIHAGTGGTEAQDWAEMLLRMYLRFAEKKGWRAKILSESRGQEAGIKSITVKIEGRYAYGWLKAEAGVHRLVRISPFDAEKMRHTSFALAEVLPELEEVEIEINPKDLRIDTFMSSGHGGQSVQTTYSAVRIVHEPTGIAVTCQNERSQLQNKETAMKILAAKLQKYYEEKQAAEKQKIRGEVLSAEWGNQIRSYVLHPYKMVKDHRTDFESKDPEDVLDGNLEKFIEEYLKSKVKK